MTVCTFGTYLAGPAAEVILQRDGTKTELLHGLLRSQRRISHLHRLRSPARHSQSLSPLAIQFPSRRQAPDFLGTADGGLPHLRSRGELPELRLLPSLKAEFVGQTFLTVLLRERDGIAAAQGFQRPDQQSEVRSPHHGSRVQDQPLPARHLLHVDYRFGSRINYDSPDNVAPISRGPNQRYHHPDGSAQQVAARRQHLSAACACTTGWDRSAA